MLRRRKTYNSPSSSGNHLSFQELIQKEGSHVQQKKSVQSSTQAGAKNPQPKIINQLTKIISQLTKIINQKSSTN